MWLLPWLLACSGPQDTDSDAPPEGLTVEAGSPTSLGTTGFGANGRIQPRGAPTTYWFEYGPTDAYGATTPVRALGPRRVAYYTESWDEGLGGWRFGSGEVDAWQATGGASGGFVRYAEPTGTDYNHTDGVGLLHLVQFFYPGEFALDYPTSALGGGEPDFRDAQVHVSVRGTGFADYTYWLDPPSTPFDRGDELVFWAQADASEFQDMTHMSNWAHTGTFLTGALYSGDWEEVTYTLPLDTNEWSYAGQSRAQERDVYVYLPLHDVLTRMDVDVFHLLMFIDDNIALNGTIDFDELTIAYRNHSVLIPSNGGTLATTPDGSDGSALTDGFRFGDGHGWVSAPDPTGPLDFVWDLADPVVVQKVMVHNHPESPGRDVEVAVSTDGVAWTPVLSGEVPTGSEHGPNFDYLLATGLSEPAEHVRVRITSGVGSTWGLGEVEVFGTGAVEQTDDDWYSVAEDVTGLAAGQTVHYRLVAESAGETVAGPDQVFVVPTGDAPLVATGRATRIGGRRVRLEGVVNTLGTEGTYTFELGPDTSYGLVTTPMWTGPEITPRTFARIVDFDHAALAALTTGTTVHWRLTVGLVAGEDHTFVAP